MEQILPIIERVLPQVTLSLLVAVVAAVVTARLALRRFYREKWWEAKMRAYTDLLQALHHMKRDLDISINAEESGIDTDTDYHRTWAAKHMEAWDEVRRQIDVGELLYSVETMGILKKLNDVTSKQFVSYYEHLDNLHEAVSACLPEIKASARRDLKLPAIVR